MYEHKHIVHCVAVSPDGTMVASGSSDGFIHLYDTRTHGQIDVVLFHRLNNSDGDVVTAAHAVYLHGVMCLAFTPDNTMVIAGGLDSTIRTWSFTDVDDE